MTQAIRVGGGLEMFQMVGPGLGLEWRFQIIKLCFSRFA